jgi:hypothetical protein
MQHEIKNIHANIRKLIHILLHISLFFLNAVTVSDGDTVHIMVDIE